jgi:hypothetical protein
VLVTDGQSEDTEFTTTPGVRVYAIGICTAVNIAFLDDIARATGGVYETIVPGENHAEVAARMVGYSSGPVIKNVRVVLTGRGDSVEELLARGDVVGVSDLFAARPTTFALRLGQLPDTEARAEISLTGQSVDGQEWGCILMSGLDSDGRQWWRQMLPDDASVHRSPLGPLADKQWAKLRLRSLNNPAERLALSLASGVLCPETAFVAVATKARPSGPAETIELPVLLPAGWEMGHDQVNSAGQACRGTTLYGSGPIDTLGVRTLASPSPFTLNARGGEPSQQAQLTPPLTTPRSPCNQQTTVLARFTTLKSLIVNDEATPDDEAELVALLTAEAAKGFVGWDELGKAQLYLVLVMLRAYGFKPVIPTALEVEPTDANARLFWVHARRELGYATV